MVKIENFKSVYNYTKFEIKHLSEITCFMLIFQKFLCKLTSTPFHLRYVRQLLNELFSTLFAERNVSKLQSCSYKLAISGINI